MINILQLNIRSIYTNRNYLETFIKINKVDIALISETWLKTTQTFSMTGYDIIRTDRADGYGGACILIKNCIPFKVINIPNQFKHHKIQLCGLSIKISNLELNIFSIYCAPGHKLDTNYWTSLIQTMKSPLLLGGDFNVWHTSTGCPYSNREGRDFIDAVHLENLCILNDGSPTMLPKHNSRPSAVDLSICTPSLMPRIDWGVVEEPFGSDHMGILISIDKNYHPTQVTQTCNKKWKLQQARWDRYETLADQFLLQMNITPDPHLNYKNFLTSINRAAELSIPQYKPYVGHKPKSLPKPWWDEECDEVRKKNIESFKQYKLVPGLSNFIKCKQATMLCRKIYNIKKRKKWREFCNSFNSSTHMKQIWSGVRALRRGWVPRRSNAHEDWVDSFLDSLTPDLAPNKIPDIPFSPHPLNNPFSLNELAIALKSKPNTSPGEDNIHYPMLSNLSASSKKILLKILNDIWINDVKIDDWSSQIIIPILKPHKDPSSHESYRPIALSSCVGKTYERLIKARLEWWLESQSKLPNNQNGFRKKRSTSDALSTFISDVHKCFSDNEYMVVANLDLNNAYNNVIIPTLIERLLAMGVPSRIVSHVAHLLSSRTIKIRHNGKLYGPRRTRHGLAQGAVLSPLLFNIYSANLNAIFGPDIAVSQYADDIILFCIKKMIEEAISTLNAAMFLFINWLEDLGLSISESKSSVTVFTRHRKYTIPAHISLGGFCLRVEPIMKTLGMLIDNKLLWKPHIEKVVSKCEQSINLLRCINHLNYGADINIALLLYKQLTLSVIDYGCFLYGDAADCHLAKLDRVQFKVLRSCLGALNSTPTNALLAEAREFPLNIRRELLASRFLVDRLGINNNLATQKVSNLTTRVLTEKFWQKRKTPILIQVFCDLSQFSKSLRRSDILPTFNTDFTNLTLTHSPYIHPNFYKNDCNLSATANNAQFLGELENRFPNSSYYYTDGSKVGEGVGCSIYSALSKACTQYRLNNLASVFTAELVAIKQCLNIVESSECPRSVIISDSQSVLQRLKQPGNNPQSVVLDTIATINKINKTSKSVHLLWVKAHNGLAGNEIADIRAKEATTLHHPYIDTLTPSDIKNYYKKLCYKKWQENYEASKILKGAHYTSIQPTIPIKPWYKVISENESQGHRKFYSTVSRLRFNHNYSPHHLNRIGTQIDPICACDGVTIADANHIILECNKNTRGRDQLWGAVVSQTKCPLPANLSTLLTDHNIYTELYKFIYDNKIKL